MLFPRLALSSLETEQCDRVELKLLVRADSVIFLCRGPIKTGPRVAAWTPLPPSSLSLKCALRESGCRIGYEPTKVS